MKQTTLNEKEQQVLRLLKEEMTRKRVQAEKERQEQSRFMEKHGKIAAGFHEKLFNNAVKAAGIDRDELTKRHEAERGSVIHFLEKHKKAAQDGSTANLRRLKEQTGEQSKRLAHMHMGGANGPAIMEYLRSATEIELIANRGTTSIAPENNIVKTKVERYGWVSSLQWDIRGDLAYANWKFIWTPPRDGFLNAITVLSTNGWGAVYPGPGCVKGSSSWSLDGTITVTQLDSAGSPFSDSVTTKLEADSYNSGDFPGTGGVIFDAKTLNENHVMTYPNQFVALAGHPLVITVTAALILFVSHGEAELNFMDGDLQLNVPFVFLFFS